jgi:hypothetical protein
LEFSLAPNPAGGAIEAEINFLLNLKTTFCMLGLELIIFK